jgi:nitrate reductase NapE component
LTTEAPAAAPVAAGRRRLLVLLGVVVAVVLLAVVAVNVLGGPGRQVETGIVVGVQATSLTDVQGFSIRTADGRTVDFRMGTLENASQFAPGHLAAHKVSLVPVRVTYVQEPGGPVAVRLEDAP